MKKQVNPVVITVALVLVLGVAGFFLWKSTAGGGSLPTGTSAPGNAGPFAPGGVANSQMGGAKPPSSQGGAPTGGNR